MKKYTLPHFKVFTEQDISKFSLRGQYKGIPIELYIEDIALFDENLTAITYFLDNLNTVTGNIDACLSDSPATINDFIIHLKQSEQINSTTAFADNISINNLRISIINDVSFSVDLSYKSHRLYALILADLSISHLYSDWGGISIDKYKMIDYPPESLNDFDCIAYEYIDNLQFLMNPDDCLSNSPDYIEIAHKRFIDAGWMGDGLIKLLWIPPIMLQDETGNMNYMGADGTYLTQGIIIWHAKQNSDGVSWLLYPSELNKHIDFNDYGYRKPIIIDELGLIYGRDAIYLSSVTFKDLDAITITGELSSVLCANISDVEKGGDIPFSLTFSHVIDFSSTELDFYNHEDYVSSFEHCVRSKKIATLRKSSSEKLTESHKHFTLHTYDVVFDIIAIDFELTFNDSRISLTDLRS